MQGHSDWAAKAQLDSVRVSIEFRRDVEGNPIDCTISGHSRKQAGPAWVHSMRMDDPRNVESEVGALLGAVNYYRPTNEKALRRIIAGEGTMWQNETLPGL